MAGFTRHGGGAVPVVTQPLPCEFFEDKKYERPLANNGWANEEILGSQAFPGDVLFKFKWESDQQTAQMVGLNSDPGTNASYVTGDYFWYLYHTGTTLRGYIYENGTYRGLPVPSAAQGDEFAIRRVGTTVEYLHNGSVVYTSTTGAAGDLYVDSSFYSQSTGFWSTGTSAFTEVSACPI